MRGEVVERGTSQVWNAFATLVLSVLLFLSAGAASGSDGSYVLNVGDTVEFDLLQEDDPPVKYTIGNQGTISLPLIGGLRVAGLQVDDARDLIRDTYIERKIFKAPLIDLSVVSYRKITVLGDVLNPGLYEYESSMTAEQALGKAGGEISALVDPELRLLRRRELEGAKVANEAELALKAAVYARLKSQSAGELKISMDLLPEDVAAAVDEELFQGFAEIERELGQVSIDNHARQVELLNEAIDESLAQLSLIEQRAEFARQAVKTAEESAERAEELRERGILSVDDLLASKAAVNAASATLVSVGETQTAMRRELGAFRRELSDLESAAKSATIAQLQLESVELKKLLAARRSVQEQLDLINQWINNGPLESDKKRINFVVRRRNAMGELSFITLAPYDEVLPGDILTVSLLPAERDLGQ